MTERLFIYGTLAPGRSNAHVLADVPGSWEPAALTGRPVEGGWGAALGYPGIVLDDGPDTVAGFVFSSEELTAHWQRLDDFEGAGYSRVRTRVGTDAGEPVAAWVYVLSDTPPSPSPMT